jgi:hypothetical protein
MITTARVTAIRAPPGLSGYHRAGCCGGDPLSVPGIEHGMPGAGAAG